ncbi:MAG: hypothetical protein HQ581_14565 [Planctomycetes bacterium]|nr:hypothetical protein [Planctomycetota bacterium]
MTLSQDVVSQAETRRGTRVGRGECFDLADESLRAAGARSAADYGTVNATADYVWGALQTSTAAALPGDILQFRNVIIEWTRADPDGDYTFLEEFPHHTAVVIAALGEGRLRILHQNWNQTSGNEIVNEHVLRTHGKTQGTIWVYRPEAR